MNAQPVISAITHVLHEHECAVVPGFGAFILRKNFGIANPFSGQIKPASHSIYFNADIKEDDGFVANALKEQFGYSFKQAGQLLTDFAQDIDTICQHGGSFKMSPLGSFHRNPTGELFFLADVNLNLSLLSYGLPVIEWQWKQVSEPIRSVTSSASAPEFSVTKNPEPVELKREVLQESLVAESTPILEDKSDEHHSEFTVSKRTQPLLWRAAASFAIISIGAGILMTVAQIWSVSSGQDLASLIPQDSQSNQINALPKQSKIAEIQSIVETQEVDSSISHQIDYGMGIDGIEAFHQAMREMKGKFTVTGGSYITLDLAKRECLLWQKMGIDACVVPVKRSSLNKVVLGKFHDESRASHFAESIKNMPTGTLSVSDVSLEWK
ncbi:MAG: hypothetical protein RJA00_807 [Bacteroidota bacterium]|jgi:hypothetical protein